MAVVKSDILKQLNDSFPNFLRKDLEKTISITLSEVKNALKRNERVELRDVFTFETRLRTARKARNPKTNQEIYISDKKTIHYKTSKKWQKKINEKT